MFDKIGKVAATIAALAAVAFGAAAIAGAASKNSSGSSSSSGYGYGQAAQGPPPPGSPPPGDRNGGRPQHKPETPLTGDTAARVKAAALDKIPGGTIVRVETDSDHGSPYEAHVRKSNGNEVEVLVNKDFEVTAVNEMGHP
jgi:hypothetical protein